MIVNNKDLDSMTAAKEKELKNWRDNDVSVQLNVNCKIFVVIPVHNVNMERC